MTASWDSASCINCGYQGPVRTITAQEGQALIEQYEEERFGKRRKHRMTILRY